MKLATPRWRTPLIFVGVLLLIGVLAPAVSAAPGAATATVTPGTVPAGTTGSYTFTLTPTSGQISSFNLTAPSDWTIAPLVSPPAGVTRPSASQIQGRSLSISSSSPFSLSFTAQAACSPSATWSVVAKSGPNFNGSSFAIKQPTTRLTPSCTAEFVDTEQIYRGPSDAAFNGGAKSENITSQAFTPGGNAMQVIVKDAAGEPRAGISIKLKLVCNVPDCDVAATLTGPVTATSGAGGIATFTGTALNPIAVDRVGIGYLLDPRNPADGITGPDPDEPFGIYEEGKNCGATCVVHGGKGGIDATVTANTPSGTMGVLVSPLGLNCATSVPPDYEYQPLSSQVVAWKYTGTGSQMISVLVDKTLVHGQTDRGNDIDVCFLVEGVNPITGAPKSFVDKFGMTRNEASGPGLLPFCSPTITHDCVVSETAVSGGDRLITFTVDDGRGKI